MGNPDSYVFSWTRKTDKEFKTENNGTLVLYASTVDYQDIYNCTPGNISGIGHSIEIQLTIKGSSIMLPHTFRLHANEVNIINADFTAKLSQL